MVKNKLSPETIFGSKLTKQEVMRMIQETPGMYARYTGLSERLQKEFCGILYGDAGTESDL